MQSVSYESTVNVSRAQAWEYLRDLSKAHYYVPGVEKTRIDTQQTEGVGTSRTVFMKNMKPLEETVIEWNDGHGFVLNLHRNGQAMEPFEKAEFVYAIEDAGPNQIRFKPQMRYRVKDNFFAKLLERFLIRGMLQKNMVSVANGLKQYYETGKPSNPDFSATQP
jgi:carbon monoxide dehydrogenase subunit G